MPVVTDNLITVYILRLSQVMTLQCSEIQGEVSKQQSVKCFSMLSRRNSPCNLQATIHNPFAGSVLLIMWFHDQRGWSLLKPSIYQGQNAEHCCRNYTKDCVKEINE